MRQNGEKPVPKDLHEDRVSRQYLKKDEKRLLL